MAAAHAGDVWQDGGWIFAELTGRPIDPRRDYQEWRDLLIAAHVRPARLHDARHTAATMLLVLKVPVRAVMDVMGWSEASMASRYMHVPDELKQEIAGQVAGLLWSNPVPTQPNDARTALTDDQRAAIRLIASASKTSTVNGQIMDIREMCHRFTARFLGSIVDRAHPGGA